MKQEKCLDTDDLQRLMDACNTVIGIYNEVKYDHENHNDEERRRASEEVMKFSLIRSRLNEMKAPVCSSPSVQKYPHCYKVNGECKLTYVSIPGRDEDE